MNKEDKCNNKDNGDDTNNNSNDDIKTTQTEWITNVKLINNLIERGKLKVLVG